MEGDRVIILHALFLFTNVKFVMRDCLTLYQNGKVAISTK